MWIVCVSVCNMGDISLNKMACMCVDTYHTLAMSLLCVWPILGQHDEGMY